VRVSQGFTVALCSVGPGSDIRGQSAFNGASERMEINPEFFHRLDLKLERLAKSGILSGIIPFLERAPDYGTNGFLMRYAAARWGAEPVSWLAWYTGEERAGWKEIGRSICQNHRHAPVIIGTSRLDEYQAESWVDAFIMVAVIDATESEPRLDVDGPVAQQWGRVPARPILTNPRCENQPGGFRRATSDDERRAAYWGFLLAPGAGVVYGAQGVWYWDSSVDTTTNTAVGATLPLWQRALFMPGAKQMALLARFIEQFEYWRLRPAPNMVVQAADTAPSQRVVAAQTESKDLALIYVPESRTIELVNDMFPSSPTITWFNPRTGDNSPAVGVVGDRTTQFPTPDPGDWVLVMKQGK